MLKMTSHVQHMVLVAGIVAVAIWIGAAGNTVLLFAAATCAAMLGALLWFVVTSTRDEAREFGPRDANLHVRVPARDSDERHRAEPSALPRHDRT